MSVVGVDIYYHACYIRQVNDVDKIHVEQE